MRGTRDTSPVILTSGTTPLSIAFTAGVEGPGVSLTTLDLVNSLRVPIEINELCFAVDEPGAAANQGRFYGGLELDLRVGQYGITNRFTPISVLGVRREMAVEITGAAAAFSPDHIRWILARPLILAPNEGFSGFLRANSTLNFPATSPTVRFVMTARGRRLPPGTPIPTPRCIPYASGGFFTTASIPLADDVFRNIFRGPLHITALNARPAPDVTNPAVVSGNWTVGVYGAGAGTAQRSAVLAVPGNNVFGQRLSLEESFDLDPNEGLLITTDTISRDFATAVAMTGWREE